MSFSSRDIQRRNQEKMSATKAHTAIVIENGSGICKAGFAGEDAPATMFPAIVGRLKHPGSLLQIQPKEVYVGDEADAKRGVLRLTSPIQHGIVTNWEDMEKIWHHVFYNELSVSAEDYPLVLTEDLLNTKANRERMVQIMFNTFKAPAVYIGISAVLALHATGKKTGTVLESGYGVTHAVPIYLGAVIPHGVLTIGLGGRDLTDYMVYLLDQRGYRFTTSGEREMVREVKEKMCYIPLDFQEEVKQELESLATDKSYEFPDGNVFTLRNERFQCPEALFQPSFHGKESREVHAMVFESIMKCKPEFRKELFANVVLAGGNTMFKGIKARLEKEIVALAPQDVKVCVIAPQDRRHSAWTGGSMLASNSDFQTGWILKKEFDQEGPTVVHKNRP